MCWMLHHQVKFVLSSLGKGIITPVMWNLGLDASIYYANSHNGEFTTKYTEMVLKVSC